MTKQKYEKYWKLTLEYTDFNDTKFLTTLQMVVDKIDELNKNEIYKYNPKDNKELQAEILSKIPKPAKSIKSGLFSTRKAINQCIKLGFVNPKYQSYHPKTKEYLDLKKSDEERGTLFSEIVYSSSKFNSSVTILHDWNQINFLIRTLEEVRKLTKEDIIALMTIDISDYKNNYATRDELTKLITNSKHIDFKSRKYNQIGFLNNVISKLDDVEFKKEKLNYTLFFKEDKNQTIEEKLKIEKKLRDLYLHRLYKNKLKKECTIDSKNAKCMIEKLPFPILIASHIKPFIKCNDDEAYDPNNGLLLSRNLDSLFDLGYITFTNDGKICLASQLDEEIKTYLKSYKLDGQFLNVSRLKYLEYHRKEIFKNS